MLIASRAGALSPLGRRRSSAPLRDAAQNGPVVNPLPGERPRPLRYDEPRGAWCLGRAPRVRCGPRANSLASRCHPAPSARLRALQRVAFIVSWR